MQIGLNERKEIVNVATLGGIVGGIEIDNPPEEFLTTPFHPGKWQYMDGKITLTDNPAPEGEWLPLGGIQ